jgi:methionine aminotransferase
LRQLQGSRFRPLASAGTYFQLASYQAISAAPDTAFASQMTTEHGVAVIPVSVFYPRGDDHRVVRFCFAKNEETLAAAGERLRRI